MVAVTGRSPLDAAASTSSSAMSSAALPICSTAALDEHDALLHAARVGLEDADEGAAVLPHPLHIGTPLAYQTPHRRVVDEETELDEGGGGVLQLAGLVVGGGGLRGVSVSHGDSGGGRGGGLWRGD